MTIEQVFLKAAEGGYPNDFGAGTPRFYEYQEWEIKRGLHGMVIDPTFWQSFGKAMGWGKGHPWMIMYEWLYRWHNFIDHLAEGKDTESFFQNL